MAIGVMAILLSLLLPSLSKARLAAQELVCMTHIREMGNLLTAYAAEYDDRFPSALGDGEEIRNDWRKWSAYRFQIYSTFPREPWRSWSGLDEHSETFYCPASQEANELPPGVCDPDYVLSASVFVESRYLDPDLPEAEWRTRLGAKVQRHGAAVFPDRKVGILENRVWHGWPGSSCIGCSVEHQFYYDSPRPGSLWFLDGHADQIHAADALPYVVRWPIWPTMPFGTTEWGIAGRDIE